MSNNSADTIIVEDIKSLTVRGGVRHRKEGSML
jgi:hypothetical protein